MNDFPSFGYTQNVKMSIKVIVDEFSGSKKILLKDDETQWDYFFNFYSKDSVDLKFSFRNVGGEDFIIFRCRKSDYKLEKGDRIYFLFEGGEIIEFLLLTKSYRVPDEKHVLENSCQITIPELDVISSKRLNMWKIKSSNESLEILSGNSSIKNFADYQNFMMNVVKGYKKNVLENIDNHKPLFDRNSISQKNERETINRRDRIPQDVMDAVWKRDEGKCVECGSKENLEFDHIIPVSKGGANTYRNIQLLCEKCNRKKSNKIGQGNIIDQ